MKVERKKNRKPASSRGGQDKKPKKDKEKKDSTGEGGEKEKKKSNFLKTLSGKMDVKKGPSSPTPQLNDSEYESIVSSLIDNPFSKQHAKKFKEQMEKDNYFQTYLNTFESPRVCTLILILSHFIPSEQE